MLGHLTTRALRVAAQAAVLTAVVGGTIAYTHLRATDQLSALPSSPIVDGLVVAVTSIDRRQTTVTEAVAPPVTRRPAGVVKKPVPRVIRVGTRPSRRPRASTAGAEGLNWAALARCESGGDPRAVNPAGYYGLYQFSPATWRSVGGRGLPSDASPREQLHRAKLLYRKDGAGQWGCGRHLFD